MPVTYKYLPELRPNDAQGYDEVSGAPLAEIETYRQSGPAGARFSSPARREGMVVAADRCGSHDLCQRYPEAMSPTDKRVPCYTHPKYQQFLDAFLREILETYPIDGIVMIRDDNGGICRCPKCNAYVAQSATHDAAWQQYLILLRAATIDGL